MKKLKIITSLSAIAIVPLSLAIYPNSYTQPEEEMVNDSNSNGEVQNLLYKYQGRIYEDVNDILRDFLLANPTFINSVNVIGDAEKALINYDYNMVNKALLPDYDASKINEIYYKPSGQWTNDFEEAQGSMVNPAFTRTRYSDGFGNYYPLSDKEKAIESFRKKILIGQIGVIDFDSLTNNSQSYNPLSSADFNQIQTDVETNLASAPYKINNQDYQHQWYYNDEPFKSFDDIYQGSEAELNALIDKSLQAYNEMQNIYSDTNGYQPDNPNDFRDFENVKGINTDLALNNQILYQPLPDQLDKQPYGLDLVFSDDPKLNTTRQELEQEKTQVKADEQALIDEYKETAWSKPNQEKMEQFDHYQKSTTVNQRDPGYYWTRGNNFKAKYSIRLYFQIDNNPKFMFADIKNDEINNKYYIYNYKSYSKWNISSTSRVKISLKSYIYKNEYSTSYYDGKDLFSFNIWDKLNIPSSAKNVNVSFDRTFDISDLQNWTHDYKGFYQTEIQFHNMKMYFDYEYDLPSSVPTVWLRADTLYLKETEVANGMNHKLDWDAIFKRQDFLQYSTNNIYFDIVNKTSTYKIYNWKFIKTTSITDGDKYEIEAEIRYYNDYVPTMGKSKKYVNNKITIPIKIMRDFEQEIKEIEEKQRYLIGVEFEYPTSGSGIFEFTDFEIKKFKVINQGRVDYYNQIQYLKLDFATFERLMDLFYNDKSNYKLYLRLDYNNKENLSILEFYEIDFSKISGLFLNLMSGQDIDEKDNIVLNINFQNIAFSSDYQKIQNVNWKWELKQDRLEYVDPRTPIPTTISTKQLEALSLNQDQLFASFRKLQIEIQSGVIPSSNHPIYQWLSDLSIEEFNNQFQEYLLFNGEKLWQIKRDSLLIKYQGLDFVSPEQGTYTLKYFFEILQNNSLDQQRQINLIIKAIEDERYEDFKNLIIRAQLINLDELKARNDDFLFLAYSYIVTLQDFLIKSSVSGNLPGGENYRFPDLSKVFLHGKKVHINNYIISHERYFNGSVAKTQGRDVIAKTYDAITETSFLNEDLKMLIKNFQPSRVVQIFSADGDLFSSGSNFVSGDEEMALTNANSQALPNSDKAYISYEGYPDLVLYKLSLIYYFNLPDSSINYYFLDIKSLHDYLLTLIMNEVEIINGGQNVKEN